MTKFVVIQEKKLEAYATLYGIKTAKRDVFRKHLEKKLIKEVAEMS